LYIQVKGIDLVKRYEKPLYIKIYDNILKNIENKKYNNYNKLPSENELSSKFSVNRHTIRKALNLLKINGYIHTIRGKGNYLCNIKVPYSISDKSNYSSKIMDLGYEPKTRLLSVNVIESFGDIANNLDLNNGLQVIEIKLLRFANDLPIAISYSYFDAFFYKKIIKELKDEENFSLYKILHKCYPDLKIKKESTIFEAILANKEQKKLLMMPSSIPLLCASTISKDQNGAFVEYGTSYFRSDICKIKIDLN
jgi:DNA-binding GntR family transcriptional regulator